MADGIPVCPTTVYDVQDAVEAYAELAIEDGGVSEAGAVAALRAAADELEDEQ
jgi:hypothetical protein